MKGDLFQDQKDTKEIKKRKRAQKQSNEEMAKWDFEKGVRGKEGKQDGIRR